MRAAILRLLYRLYLAAFSGSADVFAISERVVEYPFAIEALSRLTKPARVAIVGCHGDLLTTIVPTLGFDTYGLDIKPYLQQWPGFAFRECDIRNTGVDSEFFDAVLVISTIEHVGLFDGDPEGDHRGMRELLRTLRPGGLLVVTVPFGSSMRVVPLRQRIYDEAGLRALVAGAEVETLTARMLRGGWWRPVEPAAAPPPKFPTHCVGMIVARKPTYSV